MHCKRQGALHMNGHAGCCLVVKSIDLIRKCKRTPSCSPMHSLAEMFAVRSMFVAASQLQGSAALCHLRGDECREDGCDPDAALQGVRHGLAEPARARQPCQALHKPSAFLCVTDQKPRDPSCASQITCESSFALCSPTSRACKPCSQHGAHYVHTQCDILGVCPGHLALWYVRIS